MQSFGVCAENRGESSEPMFYPVLWCVLITVALCSLDVR